MSVHAWRYRSIASSIAPGHASDCEADGVEGRLAHLTNNRGRRSHGMDPGGGWSVRALWGCVQLVMVHDSSKGPVLRAPVWNDRHAHLLWGSGRCPRGPGRSDSNWSDSGIQMTRSERRAQLALRPRRVPRPSRPGRAVSFAGGTRLASVARPP